jgi:DNA (cytosine-5)-methyltransferase 1
MNDGLIVDMFAGGGGASAGIRAATGREVDIAVNHDLKALMMHAVNHPDALHLEEDVFNVKLEEYTRGRHVSLMWASPDCTHFSRARGGKPRSQHIRMLPWAVYQQAQNILPDVIVCENVAEIQTWEDYDSFVDSMRSLGYTFESRELVAADYGAPTIRKRWYAVFRRDGCKTEWPEQSNAKSGTLESQLLPQWVSVRSCIDLEDTGESIFERKKPLADATMRRIQAGIERYVTNGSTQFITQFNNHCVGQKLDEPLKTITCSPGHFGLVTAFLVSYYGNEKDADSIEQPLRTITCRDRFGLVTLHDGPANVVDIRLRMLRPEELKLAQGFPASYVIDHYSDGTKVTKAEQVRRIGNSVVPLMAQKIVAAQMAA